MSDTQPTAAAPEPHQQPETEPVAAPEHPAPSAPPMTERTRLRDLVFGLRSLVAVAVAGVVVGGVGGYALSAATDDDGGRMGRFGPGPGFRGGPDGGPPGGFQGGPGQQLPGQGPGQLPGQLPPQQQAPPSASATPSPAQSPAQSSAQSSAQSPTQSS